MKAIFTYLLLFFLITLMPSKVLAAEAYCVLDDGTLTFYYDDSKNSRTGTKYTIASEYNVYSTPAWNINTSITKVIFNTSFASYYPTSTAYWFNRLTDLETITGISNLKTSSVTSMRAMFSYCYSLTSLNLSNFNTSNVIDMGYMFEYCIRLTSLDLSAFKTDNVTNMSGMFSDCSRLTSLNLSSFNTSNVIEMGFMFENCTSLTSLDVSNFNTANVTDMDYMFENCNCLKTIYANSDWKSSTSIKSSSMFSGCTSLVGGKGTKYDGYHVNIYYAHPDGGTSNPGYFTYKEIEEDVPEEIEEPIPSDGGNGQTSGAYTVLNNGTLTFYYDNNRSSKTGTVYDIYTSYTGYPDWAKDSLSITKAVFDVSFANFKPTSTAYWFSCCPKMTEIEGLSRLDTRNVTDMRYMFHNCRSLIKLDTGDFLTSQVTDMSNMFSGCHNLNNADVTCFNTANVTTMEAMFMDCRSLTEIDVTGFETKNVSTMAHMFRGCSSLSEINLKNMSIASLTNTYAMFYGCEALTTIYSNTDWSTGSITSSDFMFGHCMQLKGGNGTLFDARNTNKFYALPDSGNSRPGYFTMRNGGGTPGGNVGTNGAPVYAVLNNGTLTFYCDNLWNSRTGTRYDIDDLNYSYNDQLRSYRTMPEWIEDRNYIQRAMFDPSFANYKPKSTVCWFYSCQYLTAIEGMEYLNTSEVTNMSAMFRFCYALTDVDVSHMDTRNVTDMSFVFCYCENLKHIDVSKFNTEKVTNMEHMFHTCPVETLDLRSFETSKVTDMNTMFDRCGSLKTIYAKKDKWNTDNVAHSLWMFTGCNSLVGGQGTKFNSSHTDKEYAVIDGGMCAPGYLTGDADDLPREAYAVYLDGTLTFYYDCNINCREGKICTNFQPYSLGWRDVKSDIKVVVFDSSFAEYNQLTTIRTWFQDCYNLEKVVGMENLITANVSDMTRLFRGCHKLETIDISSFDTRNVTQMEYMFSDTSLKTLDLKNFDTHNVTSMRGMFYLNPKLISIDVSSFDTRKVTNMSAMFRACGELASLDVSNFNTSNVTDMSGLFSITKLSHIDVSNFDTRKVTRMDEMFERCRNLEKIDLSSFDTGNVTLMYNMFGLCDNLRSLDLSMFNTEKVTDMHLMFDRCKSMTNLDISSFETSNVTDMNSMFYECSSLTSLDVGDFKTDNVTNLSLIFSGCSSLKSLDVSGFKTDNITSMRGMFSGCSNLTSLDMSSFKIDKVTDMSNMFFGCSALATIYADEAKWSTVNVNNGDDMFTGCTNIVGGNGTTFDANHTDIEYARIDKPGLPGYFTQKELQLEPIDIANFSNDIDEDTDLDGNVVGDIYYNISSGDGSYDSVEGCIVVTTLTDDAVVDGQDIFGDNFQANFTGIVFMVPAGEGSIIVDAQTIGTMVLKVKIGDNNPIEKELEGRLKVSFPYNVSEPTYVYIYGGNTVAARGLANRAASNGALKLYGIEVSSDAAGISLIHNPSPKVKGSYYTLDGQMLQGEPTQKDVYIRNGNKVVFK